MRLIDADKAIALAKDIAVETKSGSIYRHRCIDPSCIEELPIVDAVPVVRCKDCIYCSKKDCWTESGKATLRSCWNEKGMFTYVLDNDYCSHGYRRDNNG